MRQSDLPSRLEIEKSARLLAEVLPSVAVYRAYQRQAEKLVGLTDTFSLSPLREESITGFEMRDSIPASTFMAAHVQTHLWATGMPLGGSFRPPGTLGGP